MTQTKGLRAFTPVVSDADGSCAAKVVIEPGSPLPRMSCALPSCPMYTLPVISALAPLWLLADWFILRLLAATSAQLECWQYRSTHQPMFCALMPVWPTPVLRLTLVKGFPTQRKEIVSEERYPCRQDPGVKPISHQNRCNLSSTMTAGFGSGALWAGGNHFHRTPGG